jgi:hypothetical protein
MTTRGRELHMTVQHPPTERLARLPRWALKYIEDLIAYADTGWHFAGTSPLDAHDQAIAPEYERFGWEEGDVVVEGDDDLEGPMIAFDTQYTHGVAGSVTFYVGDDGTTRPDGLFDGDDMEELIRVVRLTLRRNGHREMRSADVAADNPELTPLAKKLVTALRKEGVKAELATPA